MPDVTRMRPKRHDEICASLNLLLELPGLKQTSRDDIAAVLAHYSSPEKWWFFMLNPDQQRMVLDAIDTLDKPGLTLKIWNFAVSFLRFDTGEIMASNRQLAEAAKTTPEEVSRALSRLTDIGALIRIKPGRYKINPHVGWTGNLHKRSEAAKDAPVLQPVEP